MHRYYSHIPKVIFICLVTLVAACGGGGGGSSGGGATVSESALFALGFGDALVQDARAVTTDSEDNVIIFGIVEGNVDFGGGTDSAADDDIFIAKFNSAGQHLWSRVINGAGNDTAGDVAVDSNDDIFVTGAFDTQINFGAGGDELDTVGAQDVFVAKLAAADGSLIWSIRAGGASSSAFGRSIAISPVDDSVVVTGVFFGNSLDLGGGDLAAVGGSQVFLARFLNLNAAHQFSASYGNADNQEDAGVTVDSLGNIVLAGWFEGAIDLGGGTLTTNGGMFNDGFLAIFNSAGTHLASASYGGTGSDVARGVAVDSNDIIILVGAFNDTIDLGGGPLTTPIPNTFNYFLARFNSSLTHLFSQRYGETGTQTDLKIAIDTASDDMILAGHHTGSINFGGGLITTGGDLDIVLARLASNGAHISSAGYGDGSDQKVRDVAVSNNARYLLSGIFDGVIDFGVDTISSMDDDAFLASLGP